MRAKRMRWWALAALGGLVGCPGNGVITDPDGVACSPQLNAGRVHIDVDYGANRVPTTSTDECQVEAGTTITWRGPPGESASFSIVFPDQSPQGPREAGSTLASTLVAGRQKITITADNDPARYKYDVVAYRQRLDPAIIIRRAQ